MREPDVIPSVPGFPRNRFARSGWAPAAVAAILLCSRVAGAGAVPVPTAGIGPAAEPGDGGPYRFAPGARIVHRIDYRSDGSTNFLAVFGGRQAEGGEPPPGLVRTYRSEVRGERSVTILEWGDGAWLADVRMAKLRVAFAVDGQEDSSQAESLRRDLSRDLFVRIAPDGKVVSLRFPTGTDTLAKTFAQSLLGITQFVVPASGIPAAGRWETDEEDRSGRSVVLYERIVADNAAVPRFRGGEDATSYRKTRLRYVGAARRRPVRELSLEPRTEPKGSLVARVRNGDGTLLSMTGTEVQDIFIGDNPVGHAENRLEMEFLARGAVSARAVTKLRRKFAALGGVSGDVSLSTNVSREEGRLALERRALDGATAGSLLSDLEEKDRSGGNFDPLLLRRLEALFALDPAACGPFGKSMAGADVQSRLFRYISAALGFVGHAQAQEALIDAVRTRRNDVPAVVALIAACQDVRAPGSALVEMLGEIAFGGKDESQVVRAAWSALGTAAANLAPVRPERAAKIVDALVREMAKTPAEEKTVPLLSALGNSASSRALPAILKCLGDPSVDVRAAAASALRTMDAPEVEPAILRALSADPAEPVRRQAASALQNREMTEAALDVQASALLKDDSANVRMRLLRTLADVIGRYPKARTAIREAAEKDPSEDIRKAARGILDENPEAGGETK